MFNLFQVIVDRVKAALLLTAARELEAEVVARHAERHAELRRAATQYDTEKQPQAAGEIRRRIEAVNDNEPLATIKTLAEELLGVRSAPASEPAHNNNAPRRLKGRTV